MKPPPRHVQTPKLKRRTSTDSVIEDWCLNKMRITNCNILYLPMSNVLQLYKNPTFTKEHTNVWWLFRSPKNTWKFIQLHGIDCIHYPLYQLSTVVASIWRQTHDHLFSPFSTRSHDRNWFFQNSRIRRPKLKGNFNHSDSLMRPAISWHWGGTQKKIHDGWLEWKKTWSLKIWGG